MIIPLHCACYVNLCCLEKHLLWYCMVYGHIKGFAILLECVYINSGQPQWEMRWILISSGIREVQWNTEDKTPGGEKEVCSSLGAF